MKLLACPRLRSDIHQIIRQGIRHVSRGHRMPVENWYNLLFMNKTAEEPWVLGYKICTVHPRRVKVTLLSNLARWEKRNQPSKLKKWYPVLKLWPMTQIPKSSYLLPRSRFEERPLARNLFWLLCCNPQDLNSETRVPAANGKVALALDLFALCLMYFKDKALETAAGQGRKYEPAKIQWVVTVPAIWELTAKEFMRQAAYKVE